MAASRGNLLLPALILMGLGTVWTAGLTLRPHEGEAMAAIFPPAATIGRIEQAIGTIAAAANRQSASIDTISHSARIAVDAVGQIGSTLGEVTGFTESLAAISTRQTEQASHMASDVDGLVGQVDAFVGEVRRG